MAMNVWAVAGPAHRYVHRHCLEKVVLLSRLVFALNGGFYHADKGLFVDHQAHDRAVNFGDFSDDARIGHDFEPLPQCLLKFLRFLLPLDLRADQKKVKNDQDKEREQHAEKRTAAARLRCLKENEL